MTSLRSVGAAIILVPASLAAFTLIPRPQHHPQPVSSPTTGAVVPSPHRILNPTPTPDPTPTRSMSPSLPRVWPSSTAPSRHSSPTEPRHHISCARFHPRLVDPRSRRPQNRPRPDRCTYPHGLPYGDKTHPNPCHHRGRTPHPRRVGRRRALDRRAPSRPHRGAPDPGARTHRRDRMAGHLNQTLKSLRTSLGAKEPSLVKRKEPPCV